MSRTAARYAVAGALSATALLVACAGDEPAPSASTCGPGPSEEGERVLLDGTSETLDGWRMAGPGRFEPQGDCSVRTVGGMGLLWYPEELGAYRLTLDWKTDGEDNSGVFVGFPDPGDDPWVAVEQGYEIQIDASDRPDRTTGAVYGFQGADVDARDAVLNPSGEWNTYLIEVQAPAITVSLNGVVVNRFRSDDPARDLTSGHVGLQNHGDRDTVFFRDVRVVDLAEGT